MPLYTFTGLSLKNADGTPAPYASVQGYADSDSSYATPLPILSLSGLTLPAITADGNGDVPDFQVNTAAPWLRVHADGYQDQRILSIDEVMRVVTEASTSAASAATAAGAASTASVTAIEQMRSQFLAFLGNNPNPNGIVALAPLDPEPDPAAFNGTTLVVRLTATEV